MSALLNFILGFAVLLASAQGRAFLQGVRLATKQALHSAQHSAIEAANITDDWASFFALDDDLMKVEAEDMLSFWASHYDGGKPLVPALPINAGCYAWAPSGCPRNPLAKVVEKWVRDTVGEARFGAADSRMACEQNRKTSWSGWCGSEDIKMRLVLPAPDGPSQPGCYVWAPQGCSLRPWFKMDDWTHDTFGETKMFAAANGTICEYWRLQQYNKYCGVDDMRVLFVPPSGGEALLERAAPPLPTEPGCYVWTPQGCPRKPRFGLNSSQMWLRDVHGEQEKNALNSQDICEVSRALNFSHWCGIDVKMVLVSEAPASEKRAAQVDEEMPVQKEEQEAPASEKRATQVDEELPVQEEEQEVEDEISPPFMEEPEDEQASGRQAAQLVQAHERVGQPSFAEYIAGETEHVTETQVPQGHERHVVVKQEAELVGAKESRHWTKPAQTGCYVRAPAGCTHEALSGAGQLWLRDEGDNETGLVTNRTTCELRKRMWDRVCDPGAVEMKFHFEAPVLPTEPGCYVWAPEGCPKHAWFRSKSWVHDAYGEMSANSAKDKTVCEHYRREQFKRYCNNSELRTHFVPPA